MSLVLTLALALQTTISVGSQSGVKVTTEDEGSKKKEVRRIPVTDVHRRTAFKDPGARELLLRARAARLTMDSLLLSYDATSYQRISVGMSLRETARERLFFRTENASHIQWHRDVGARVEILGARTALPFLAGGEKEAEREVSNEAGDMSSLPYYPGREQLWLGDGLAQAEVDEREMVHPIAEGSEAYYFFETGDSVIMTLPDGKRITLRELRITAREPKWNVSVGSFWFETVRGDLVRAVYRLSAQMDIWAVAQADDSTSMDDVPMWVKPMISPMLADVTAISIEYSLHEQRFWLPKFQALEGYARVSFMRIPLRFEERYRYASVNGFDTLTAIPEARPRMTSQAYRDSLKASGLDSAAVRKEMRTFYVRRDTLDRAERKSQCDATGNYTTSERRYDSTLAVYVTMPCDTAKLRNSPELPPSIYDAGDELFGLKEREELVKSLTMDLQPGWSPQRPSLEYGLGFTRYNRVEGLSTGGATKAVLGKGYTAALGARLSLADAQINGDLSLSRSNGRRALKGTVYRRLVVSSDFGDPLSFGASLGAILYARDEGFYHRAWGGELTGTRPMRGGLDWRLFAEQQWSASVESRWTLFRGANDARFVGNVLANRATLVGAALRWRGSHGLDPQGWRLTGDIRLEGATGDYGFGRGFVETTVSKGIGPVAASLTGAVGTSAGELPAQRQFFLGGLQSVRGVTEGTGVGESFWLSRLEFGTSAAGARPVVFGDLGWAGPRNDWGGIRRPLAGAGVGASFLDGMIRFDVARGIYPEWQTRLDLYLEARF